MREHEGVGVEERGEAKKEKEWIKVIGWERKKENCHFQNTVLLSTLKAQRNYRQIDIREQGTKDHQGSNEVGVWVIHREKMEMDSYLTPTHKNQFPVS